MKNRNNISLGNNNGILHFRIVAQREGNKVNLKSMIYKREKMKFDFIVVGATGMQGRIVTKRPRESGYSVLCVEEMKRVQHLLNKHKKKLPLSMLI